MWDSIDAALSSLRAEERLHWEDYLGFYSSWLGGYFREPWAMLIPMDDHGFHRGDGVFEAVRIHDRAYIDLDSHLRRLANSAAALAMTLPATVDETAAICVELGRRTNAERGILRLFVTRGPGGFSPNPGEVVGHQLYAAITRMHAPDPRFYQQGCRAMFSTVPAKEPFWSQIKSCNYLQNVLMKKECVEKGFDFSISLDENGWLCEGATENLLVVSGDNEVLVPSFDYTLRGTTVLEVMRIAETLVTEGEVRAVRFTDLCREDLLAAREAAFVGTTLGVLPIASVDGHEVGTGKAGRVCSRLHQELLKRMARDPRLRTPF